MVGGRGSASRLLTSSLSPTSPTGTQMALVATFLSHRLLEGPSIRFRTAIYTGVCDLFDEYFFAINPDVSLRLSLFLLQSRFLL
jgi:hypothetical protein